MNSNLHSGAPERGVVSEVVAIPEAPTPKKQKPRLAGVDWMRAIAAFGVVSAHTPFSASTGIDLDPTAEAILLNMRINVPFFVTTALVFATWPAIGAGDRLKRKMLGLLIPFTFWTLTYIALRIAKLGLMNGDWRIWPFGRHESTSFVLGAASVQLYFMPMLMVGILVSFAVAPILKKLRTVGMSVALVVSVVASHLLRSSGNAFNLGRSLGFEHAAGSDQSPVVQIGLAAVAWAITLLPHVVIAVWIRRSFFDPLSKKVNHPWQWVLGGLLVLHLAVGMRTFPEPSLSYVTGAVVFLFAVAISPHLPSTKLSRLLGRWTFGIYLMHVIVVQALHMVVPKVISLQVLNWPLLFSLALLTYVSCVVVCAALEKWAPERIRALVGLRM